MLVVPSLVLASRQGTNGRVWFLTLVLGAELPSEAAGRVVGRDDALWVGPLQLEAVLQAQVLQHSWTPSQDSLAWFTLACKVPLFLSHHAAISREPKALEV